METDTLLPAVWLFDGVDLICHDRSLSQATHKQSIASTAAWWAVLLIMCQGLEEKKYTHPQLPVWLFFPFPKLRFVLKVRRLFFLTSWFKNSCMLDWLCSVTWNGIDNKCSCDKEKSMLTVTRIWYSQVTRLVGSCVVSCLWYGVTVV
jgi:hypothetical protein